MAVQSTRSCRHADTRYFDSYLCCFSCGMTFVNSLTYLPSKEDNPRQADSPTSQQLENPRQGDSYVYRQLDLLNHRQGVRLIALQPGSGTDELQCEIEHTELSNASRYEALSYTWAGDGDNNSSLSGRIKCLPSGKFIRITGNCEAALRRVRKEDSKRYLWVDAICINQADIKERNHQVNHMKAIFENALQVVIYLGQSANRSDRLFEYLDKDSPGLLPSTKCVLELFSRRWFHRVWVLQEVVMARRAIICCGGATYKWKNFVDCKDFFHRLRTRRMPIDLPSVFRFGMASNDGEDWQLTSLLHATRHCSATDPRDKVFALFNLIKDSSKWPFKVDYSMSVQLVYFRVATWSIRKERSLSILSYVTGKSRLPNIPSWVPDWTIKSTTRVLPPLSGRSPHLVPGGSDYLSPAVIWQAETLEPILRVDGLRLGSIWVEFQPPKSEWKLDKWETARDSLNCPLQQCFWEEFSHRLQRSPCYDGDWPSDIESSGFIGEVPPAFGGHGLCHTCQNLDRLYWNAYVKCDIPLRKKPYKRRCICATFRRDKQSEHFLAEELDEFFDKMQQYGAHRRPFTTGYSLGFGPADTQTGDSVWLLKGAEVPVVLRPVEDHYILIGSCYLHAIEREFDVCGICRTSNSRYQRAAAPPIPQTTHRSPPPPAAKPQEQKSYRRAPLGDRCGNISTSEPKSTTKLGDDKPKIPRLVWTLLETGHLLPKSTTKLGDDKPKIPRLVWTLSETGYLLSKLATPATEDILETSRSRWSMPSSIPLEWEIVAIH